MSDEPKPCPFCGSRKPKARFGRNWGWYMGCECGAVGPKAETRGEAIAAWNGRERGGRMKTDDGRTRADSGQCPEMPATEELRRLLDERGVEWDAEYEGHTEWRDAGGVLWDALEDVDGTLCMSCDRGWYQTPAQAVEATLGPGACHADETCAWECAYADNGHDARLTVHVMECRECGGTYEHVNGSYEFCPRCGRRFVE